MKRKIGILMLLLACLLVMAGCGCDHEWTQANCTAPKTCSLCGKTEGEPLGHTWAEADCTKAKTCTVCGATEGEALGHTWTDATCTEPKTCSVCGMTEGEALGHAWLEATTESPQTCAACGMTEGEPIVTDARFTSAAAAPVRGTWTCDMTMSGLELGLEDFPGDVQIRYVFSFGPAGDLKLTVGMADPEGYKASMQAYMEDLMYAQFADQDLNREEADAAMTQAYGMTVPQYVKAYVDSVDVDSLSQAMDLVYYIEGNQFYSGYSWDAPMDAQEFSVEGDVLCLIGQTPEDTITLTRVTE